jgi:hypothetical protein
LLGLSPFSRDKTLAEQSSLTLLIALAGLSRAVVDLHQQSALVATDE